MTYLLYYQSYCPFEIEESPDEVKVEEGGSLNLFCGVDEAIEGRYYIWTHCRWTRTSDGSICDFKQGKNQATSNYDLNEHCSISNFSRIRHIDTTRNKYHKCGVNIHNARIMDNGPWNCVMDYIGYNVPDKRLSHDEWCTAESTVSVEVLVFICCKRLI